MKKEIIDRLKSICYILIFLIVFTWFIFGPREDLIYMTASINSKKSSNNDIIILSDDTLNINDKKYQFKIKNKTNKSQIYELVLVSDFLQSTLNNCKIMSNNFLQYQLNDTSQKRIVPLSGIIAENTIEPYEIKDFSLLLSKSDQIKNKYCYYPTLKIVTK